MPLRACFRTPDRPEVCLTDRCFVDVWALMHNVRVSHGSSKHGSSQQNDNHDKNWSLQDV